MKHKLHKLMALVLFVAGVQSANAYSVAELESEGWTKVESIENVDNYYYVFVDAKSSAYMMVDAYDRGRAYYRNLSNPLLFTNSTWVLESKGDGSYALKNAVTSRYFNSGDAGWNNSLGAANDNADYRFALANGKYDIQSVTVNQYLGPWNNDGSVAGYGEDIAANKSLDMAPGFWVYAMERAQYNEKLATVYDQVTNDNPLDMTSKIENSSVERDIYSGWTLDLNGGNNQRIGDAWEFWIGTASNLRFNLSQVLTALPGGKYTASVEMANSFDNADAGTSGGRAYLYVIVGDEAQQEFLSDPVEPKTAAATERDKYTVNFNVPDNTDGAQITIGIKTVGTMDARWFTFDNFKLTFLGEASDEEALNAAKEAFLARAEKFRTFVDNDVNWGLQAINLAYLYPVSDEVLGDEAYGIVGLVDRMDEVTDIAVLDYWMAEMGKAEAILKEAAAGAAKFSKWQSLIQHAVGFAEAWDDEAAQVAMMYMEYSVAYNCSTVEAINEAAAGAEDAYKNFVLTATPADGAMFDMTFMIVNPDFEKNVEGWECVKAQHNDGAGYNDVGGIAEIAEWGATSWDASMSQELTGLPNGTYVVKASWMAATGIEMIFAANEGAKTVTGIGDKGGNIAKDGSVVEMGEGHRGWQYVEVEGIVKDGTLTITVSSSAQAEHMWSNADAFELYYAGPVYFPERSTAAAPKYYTIASYNRGGVLTDVNGAAQHIAANENSFWYFVKANANGGVNICNLNGNYLNEDLTIGETETPAVWYILPNGVNENGLSISKTNPISGSSCIDANNHNAGVGSYDPKENDWEGTTWVFAEVDYVKDIENHLAANAENHAEVPALGQYTTKAYEVLAAAKDEVSNPAEALAAIKNFEKAKNLPVFTINGVINYAAGKSIYDEPGNVNDKGNTHYFKATDATDMTMLWALDMTETEVGVVESVGIHNVGTGAGFWGCPTIKITETEEANEEDGIFLFYTTDDGSPIHAQNVGQLICRYGDKKATSGSAWTFTYVGSTYELYDLSEVYSAFEAQAMAFMEFGQSNMALYMLPALQGEYMEVMMSVENLYSQINGGIMVLKADVVAAMELMTTTKAKVESVAAYYSEDYNAAWFDANAVLDLIGEEAEEYDALVEATNVATVTTVAELEEKVAVIEAVVAELCGIEEVYPAFEEKLMELMSVGEGNMALYRLSAVQAQVVEVMTAANEIYGVVSEGGLVLKSEVVAVTELMDATLAEVKPVLAYYTETYSGIYWSANELLDSLDPESIEWANLDDAIGQVYDLSEVTTVAELEAKVAILKAAMDEITVTGINGIDADANVVIYDLSGRRVEKAVKGIYIVNGKKVFVK